MQQAPQLVSLKHPQTFGLPSLAERLTVGTFEDRSEANGVFDQAGVEGVLKNGPYALDLITKGDRATRMRN